MKINEGAYHDSAEPLSSESELTMKSVRINWNLRSPSLWVASSSSSSKRNGFTELFFGVLLLEQNFFNNDGKSRNSKTHIQELDVANPIASQNFFSWKHVSAISFNDFKSLESRLSMAVLKVHTRVPFY